MARAPHAARHPVHVTLRAHRGLPSLRHQALLRVLERSLARVAAADFQVVHYSLQRDHVHLVVEARDRDALSLGMRRLVIGLALRLNQALGRGRRGKVWGDRWHRHDLRTPRETRNALVYVFGNARHHGVASARRALDRFSSAAQFAGWLASRDAPDVGLASRDAPDVGVAARGPRDAPDVGLAARASPAGPASARPPRAAATGVHADPRAAATGVHADPRGVAPVATDVARSAPRGQPTTASPRWVPPRPRTWLLRAGYVRGGGALLVDDVTTLG